MRDFQPVSGAPVPEQWLTPDGCYLLPVDDSQPQNAAWFAAWDATVEGPDADGPDEGC